MWNLLRKHSESAIILSMTYWKLIIMDIAPMRCQVFILRFIAEKVYTVCSRTNCKLVVGISSVTAKMNQ